MLTTQLKLILFGIAFLVIFALGYWLNHAGKPYNTLVFTLHKLVSIGLVVFLAVTISRIHRVTPLDSTTLTIIILTGICFLLTVATGGMLSVDRTWPAVIHLLHKILPFLTLASTSATLYLLLIRLPGA